MRVGPYPLVNKIRYPPIFQGMGTEDEVFHISQVLSFDIKLREMGLESKVCAIEGEGHSFYMKIEVGDEIYVSVILPAVDFAEHCVTRSRDNDRFYV
jgi:dipeptidyl aminopeptidase/acylaminoacyl peptidase